MKFVLFFICVCFGFGAFGQDLDTTMTIAAKKQINFEAFHREASTPLEFGQFHMPRFQLPTTLSFDTPNIPENIDILAVARAKERYKQAHARHGDFTTRQLEQIKSRVQIYTGHRSFLNRTGDNLNFYGKDTPDGGIRNEVYEDIRQPEIYPYYHLYGRDYFGHRPRHGFYIYGR